MHIGAGKKGERCGRMGVNEGKGTLSKAGKAHKRKELWQQVKQGIVSVRFAVCDLAACILLRTDGRNCACI